MVFLGFFLTLVFSAFVESGGSVSGTTFFYSAGSSSILRSPEISSVSNIYYICVYIDSAGILRDFFLNG